MADEFVPFPHFATNALHVGQEPEQWNSCAVVPPISMATTFKQTSPGETSGYEYSRSGNPTRDCLEKSLAAAEGGKHCITCASGLAATATIVHLLKSGDHVLCMNDVYGGTNRYFQRVAGKFGVEISLVDCTDLDKVKNGLKDNTKIVWIESPTNPTMQLVDIAAVSKTVHSRNPEIMVVLDNTFMSSYFQRPLDFGADMVFHSLTKYMNGHCDVVMGAVITNSDEIADKLKFYQNAVGAVPSPFDCFLVNRGLKTLHLRMQQHMKNGLAVAHFLENSPHVVKVLHPGLPSHPQHELGKKQMRGYSGMVTFYIKGGLEAARTFLSSLKIFTLAESLGGIESLAEHPAIMTHASVPAEERAILGIDDGLIRLSVGIEDETDLVEDIEQALKKAVA